MCDKSVTLLEEFVNEAASPETTANPSALNEVSFALRELESQFDAFRAKSASVTAAQDLRLFTLGSRPTGVTAFVVPLVRPSARVAALEAMASVDDSPLDATDSGLTSSTMTSRQVRSPSTLRTY